MADGVSDETGSIVDAELFHERHHPPSSTPAVDSLGARGAQVSETAPGRHPSPRHRARQATRLAVYLGGTMLTAFSWDFWRMAASQWVTGFGIGDLFITPLERIAAPLSAHV